MKASLLCSQLCSADWEAASASTMQRSFRRERGLTSWNEMKEKLNVSWKLALLKEMRKWRKKRRAPARQLEEEEEMIFNRWNRGWRLEDRRNTSNEESIYKYYLSSIWLPGAFLAASEISKENRRGKDTRGRNERKKYMKLKAKCGNTSANTATSLSALASKTAYRRRKLERRRRKLRMARVDLSVEKSCLCTRLSESNVCQSMKYITI